MFQVFKKLTKIIILALTVLSLASCERMPGSWKWGARARPLTGVRGFPPANTDYGRGFKNGCENAWSAVAKGWTDAIPISIDPMQMSKNTDYANGWWDGMEQCTYIIDWDVL